jgi:hypothetical protein
MKYFLLISFFMVLSCNSDQKQPNITKGEMFKMATLADPGMKIQIGTMQKAAVTCEEYKIPCKVGYLVKIKNMEIKVLYYETQENALKSATRIRGYVSRNWAFDDVRGEPILERLIVKYMNAKPAF